MKAMQRLLTNCGSSRTLINSGQRVVRLQRRGFLNFSGKEKSDEQLAQDSHSFFSLFYWSDSIIGNNQLPLDYNKLVSEQVILPDYSNGMYVMSRLQNPLLKKYSFAPLDFMQGARAAIPQLISTIYSEELAKVRAGRGSVSSETDDFLRAVLSTAVHQCVTSSMMRGAVVENVTLDNCFITEVKTFFIDRSWFRQRMNELFATNLAVNLFKKVRSGDEVLLESIIIGGKEDKEEMQLFDCERYVAGSIVAQVELDIYYSRQSRSLDSDSSTESSEVGQKKSSMVLEACLSGQSEQNWIVRSFGKLPPVRQF
eukprot:gene2536-2777_t